MKVVNAMAKSMTGYGRAEYSTEEIDVSVEIKSVNHRYLEFSPKVPRGCAFLEDKLKTLVSQKISRGKVDMFVSINSSALGDTEIKVNKPYADAYINALKELSEEYGIKNDISVSTVARNSDVFEISKSEIDEEKVWEAVKCAAGTAIDKFIEMRTAEGKKLSEDVLNRLQVIRKKVKFIEERSPETVKEYREKLEERMKELLGDVKIDEQRLLLETGIMADKLAVCEETVRLESHMSQLSSLILTGGPIGRKLDFIVQEMNRETNTIGSKAQDIDITARVVDIKSEIEKIREQIQNIE